MADSGGSITLKVTFSDGSSMSLSDLLQQAHSIPSDATVRLSDGTVESASAYQATIDAAANQMLDDFASAMTVAVEDLSDLGAEMYFQSTRVSDILSTLQARMHGLGAAIGNDDLGRSFKSAYDQYAPKLVRNFDALSTTLSNFGGGLDDSATSVFNCEQATLEGFGRQADDPRQDG